MNAYLEMVAEVEWVMKQPFLVLLFSAMLHASAIITITPGPFTTRTGATTIDFDQLGSSTVSPYVNGIVSYEWLGPSPFVIGSLVNNRIAPAGDGTVYLGVGTPGYADLVQMTFAVPIRYFGFYYGTPDSYNWMTAYAVGDLAGPSMGWTGTTLLPHGTLGAYVNFEFSSPVYKIIMASVSAAFESDNHAFSASGAETTSAIPEALSFSMVGFGIAVFFVILRFRRELKTG